MNAPIIHIGYHKTATSWFQKCFYPCVRNGIYLDRPRVRDAFLNTTAFSFDPGKARSVLGSGGRALICEEDLCGYPDNGGLLECLSKDVAYRLHRVYPEARIVIFIRHQLDMIRASYLQYVRGGGTASLRGYLFPYGRHSSFANRWYKKPMCRLEHFAYHALIRHYQGIFGAERVHVFCYEDFAADNRRFARVFAERFDLDVDWDRVVYKRCNESLRTVSAQLARFSGPFCRSDTANRLVLLPIFPKWLHKGGIKAFNRTALAGAVITNSRMFGGGLYRFLHNQYVADNRALIGNLDLPLRAHGYPLTPLTDFEGAAADVSVPALRQAGR